MIARLKHSLTFRLALMFSLSAFVVLFLLGFAVLYVVNKHFILQDRMILETQSQHIANKLETIDQIEQVTPFLTKIISNNPHSGLGEYGFTLVILNKGNKVLYSSSPEHNNIAVIESKLITPNNELYTLQQHHDSYRLFAQPITIEDQTATIIVGLNINHHQTFLVLFRQSMWISIGIAVFVMGLLACIVAKRGLKPLHTLMDQTSKITVNNLSQPIPVNTTYLEISQLTATFNDVLDRLNHSFQRLISFSSDLAHELRTPLSTIKMQNQVMLSRPRSIVEYQQALQDNAQVLDQMTKMVTDMLFLAKSDNGLIYPEVTPIDLNDEMATLFDFYEYLAQEKDMNLQLTGHGKIYGDKSLLRRALSNLITNAIHYGDKNSAITINIVEQSAKTQITITNYGDTIEPKHLPHLFERFYRVDSARKCNNDGAGLGLAITAAIIHAHQGKINVASHNRQTSFTLTFPQLTV